MKDTNREVYKLESLSKIRNWNLKNKVLCRVLDPVKEKKTKSGIYIAPYTENQSRHKHADTLHEVVKVPEKLYVAKGVKHKHESDSRHRPQNFRLMEWETDIEIGIGDHVLCKPWETYNCITFIVGEEEYRLLHYSSLMVAWKRVFDAKYAEGPYMLRDDLVFMKKPIMLNGYVICESVGKLNTSLHLPKSVEKEIMITRGKSSLYWKTK